MTPALDAVLVKESRRYRTGSALNRRQLVAINLFWRSGVKGTVLARAYGVSKNTVYSRALTGGPGYYAGSRPAAELNAEIDRLLAKETLASLQARYATPEEFAAVHRELEREIARREGEDDHGGAHSL